MKWPALLRATFFAPGQLDATSVSPRIPAVFTKTVQTKRIRLQDAKSELIIKFIDLRDPTFGIHRKRLRTQK